jgi:hypothetical protein
MRILRGVGSGNRAPLTTAFRKALTVATIYPGLSSYKKRVIQFLDRMRPEAVI